jgi:hypothetical protein
MQEPITSILSAMFGSGLASVIAKIFIDRSIARMDEVTRRLEMLTNKLSIIESRLETLDKMKSLVFEHDRKIIAFETRIKKHGSNSRRLAQDSL